MTILLLETATGICSTALERDGRIIAERHSDEPNAHSSKLAVFIDDLFKEANLQPAEIDAVCVSSGPGSYTGLRIGASSAKGFCYALNKPLIAIPTLQNMALLYYAQHPDYNGLVCPMIDARRMECYTAIFSRNGQEKETAAEVIESGIYDQWLDKQQMAFIGDGAEKTRPVLSVHQNAIYDPDFRISSAGMAALAEEKLKNGET